MGRKGERGLLRPWILRLVEGRAEEAWFAVKGLAYPVTKMEHRGMACTAHGHTRECLGMSQTVKGKSFRKISEETILSEDVKDDSSEDRRSFVTGSYSISGYLQDLRDETAFY